MGTGQAPVKAYNWHLCNLIHDSKAKPSFIISHELPLDEAPDAYGHFDARDEGLDEGRSETGFRCQRHRETRGAQSRFSLNTGQCAVRNERGALTASRGGFG
jgi:hypothetical protein